jgi:hypothetical protein
MVKPPWRKKPGLCKPLNVAISAGIICCSAYADWLARSALQPA